MVQFREKHENLFVKNSVFYIQANLHVFLKLSVPASSFRLICQFLICLTMLLRTVPTYNRTKLRDTQKRFFFFSYGCPYKTHSHPTVNSQSHDFKHADRIRRLYQETLISVTCVQFTFRDRERVGDSIHISPATPRNLELSCFFFSSHQVKTL